MLAFCNWLPSNDFRAEVRFLVAGKRAALRIRAMFFFFFFFFGKKKLIEDKKLLLIGRRRIKLEGGERGSFLTCPHRPLLFLQKVLFLPRPSEKALNMLKNVTRPSGPVYPYDSE